MMYSKFQTHLFEAISTQSSLFIKNIVLQNIMFPVTFHRDQRVYYLYRYQLPWSSIGARGGSGGVPAPDPCICMVMAGADSRGITISPVHARVYKGDRF